MRRHRTINDFAGKETVGRRSFLKGAAGVMTLRAMGTTAAAAAFQALLTQSSATGTHLPFGPDYGPLQPAFDEATGLPLLKLPEGFQYKTFGWAGDPLRDGTPTPGLHDGMGVVEVRGNYAILVRNHEQGSNNPSFAHNRLTFDAMADGGTTNLKVNLKTGDLEHAWVSLSGTVRNCAGGVTPWGSWLTCEETTLGPANDNNYQETHGWIFEVPAKGRADAQPLKDMGRFVHEAVAIDPATGYVYETEDSSSAGFYRFVPNVWGELAAGGQLQMLRVHNLPQAGLSGSTTAIPVGAAYDVEWINIDDPETSSGVRVFDQGFALGGAKFTRLEGTWYESGSIYIVSTNGGTVGKGQIWEYQPRRERMTLIFESPDTLTLSNPDNVTVSPAGGVLLCEDSAIFDEFGIGQRLQALDGDGGIFPFAQNNVILNGEVNGFTGDFRSSEWAGATFSPDGRWLFANIQRPGLTFAITGRWENGVLGRRSRFNAPNDRSGCAPW